ncbi:MULTISPECIES: 3-oxoacyl-ACP reductase FabG [unclassified Desulfosporosinus]|uniref:SDR family NAD(P)-dependent oxidoreductase n=1 Tax=unclassified Desulfosporosinus TaxID=2633794 RepID=UPI000223AFE4|nr:MULTISPECIES: 3-oxoacyl-ACP reductase FabG [unclassified Desulfosporosinus]EGW41704.1 3-oxoacyl-(Acyl-carrier-protein) reductase [Desulfosporosinus sp. OT]ODA39855.1 3-oxoacyl-[acyl-carrier protein] reductase [Desulfosporosinus sp. BG]
MKIKDRVALITGSGQGIGKAIALTFAREGAKIAVNDISCNEAKAMETVEELRKLGVEAELFLADVSKEDEVNSMVANVLERFKKVDILVNNAGINRDGLVHKGNLANWEAVMAVNLTGPFICTKAVLPAMREQRYGRIVNLSSLTARKGIFGTGYYATSKSGLIGLTKVTAVENATKGITCNALAPGYINTDMMNKYPEEQLKALIATIPAGRFAEPEEVADAALFLVADSSSYITGAVLDINGGSFI